MAEEYIRDPVLETEEMRKVFVGGVPSDAQDEDFKALFEKVSGGTVAEAQIVRKDGQAGKSLFGFVTFQTSEQVDDLLLNRASLLLNGKNLDVNRAVPKNDKWIGAREKTKKLFIANLPRDAKEDQLELYLKKRHPEKYGKIESIQLIKEKNEDGSRKDINKGYGFVFVTSEDMADKMAIQHNTFEFGGRKIEMKKSVATGGEGGRGRGRGGRGGMRGGRGGGQFQQGGYGGGGFGGQYGGGDQYGGGYGAGGYGGYGAGGYEGYGSGYGGGYGGGYGAQNNRFQPY